MPITSSWGFVPLSDVSVRKKYLQVFNSEKHAGQIHVSRNILAITIWLTKVDYSLITLKKKKKACVYTLILFALLPPLLPYSCDVN